MYVGGVGGVFLFGYDKKLTMNVYEVKADTAPVNNARAKPNQSGKFPHSFVFIV